MLHKSTRHSVRSWGKFKAKPEAPRKPADCLWGCLSKRLRAPQLWVSSVPGPGLRLPVPPHAAGPTGSSPSISPKVSEAFRSLRKMSRLASPGQLRPGNSSPGCPATHQVGQSNSGRLEPEFAAAAILCLPLPFGGPEACRETGRPRGERRHPSSLCVRAPVRARSSRRCTRSWRY